jgi:sulfate adenylyltransferase
MNSDLVGPLPHGGTLVNRVLRGELRAAMQERAKSLRTVQLSPMAASDLELIAVGAFSPLTGFMGRADYERVVHEMRLASGLVWSVPVTLPVEADAAKALFEGMEIALCEGERIVGVMEVTEIYPYDEGVEAELVYRTREEAHPGVARLYRQGDYLLGGDIWLVNWPQTAQTEFPEFRHTPAQARRMFAHRGWKRVVGFQTRNPIHRAHEYLTKVALETVDGLLIHPLVGDTKGDDVPVDVRVDCYRVLLDGYYPEDRVLLSAFPAAMRYAGPREAIWHAICRKNYGCSHFIVGRDHAGVGDYYGTYDAQLIFDDFEPHELDIEPMFFEHSFFCRACGSMASAKTCPHGGDDHVFLSGTKVRELLGAGEVPPEEFTRREVAEVLIEAYCS